MENLEQLVSDMEAVLIQHDRAYWLAAFDAAGVPAGPVRTIGEALNHPQAKARGMVVEVSHPQAGATETLGCPVHFSATPTRIDRAAPMLGQHTRELLSEYGYDEAEIDSMLASGVVADVEAVQPGN